MRTPKLPQSSFSSPLNEILGTEANVRVLRELCRSEAPLPRSEIAERVGLSVPGTSSAVAKLRQSGIVEEVGAGSRQSFSFRGDHPLAPLVRALFLAESARVDALMDELRSALDSLSPAPRAAWMVEPAASDPPGTPLGVEVLGAARELSRLESALQPVLDDLERRFDVAFELRAMTEADLVTASEAAHQRLERATPVHGPHPPAFVEPGSPPPSVAVRARATHTDRELQAAAAAAWIADRLNRDPTLPKRARTWLVHRAHAASARETGELDEWLRVLDTSSIPRIQHLLLSPGERAVRMRQSNPFIPVLTDRERDLMRKAAG